MPNPLSNVVLSGTDYSDAATITGVWGHPTNGRNGGGTYDVSNGSVFYQLLYNTTDPRAQPSGFASSDWGPEVLLRPSQGIIPAIAYGIRFRNVDSASPATVNAYIAPPGQPALQINSTNDVSATVAATKITGQVSAAGGIVAGSGFSIVKGGAGIYTVNFTTAFAAVPTVLAVIAEAMTTNALVVTVNSVGTGSFGVTTATGGGALANHAFNFEAQSTV